MKIQVPPGVLADFSDHDAAGRWIAGDKIRFRDGRLQTMSGWRQAFSKQAVGWVRALAAWTLLDGTQVVAAGSDKKLYIFAAGDRFDITPVRASGTLGNNPFATTSGSAAVTVAHTSHTCAVGDYVRFAGATSVGGLTLNGEWVVSEVVDANSYRFVHTGTASATATGGGAAVTFSYDIHVGEASAVPGLGFGAARWGESFWGGPRPATISGLAYRPLRLWSLAPWGEDLVACIVGDGPVYHWDASSGLNNNRAAAIAGSPEDNRGIVVSGDDRHLIVYGSGGDALAVQWPHQGTLSTWTFGAAYTSDLRRVLYGSRLVAGLNIFSSQVLLWSDDTLYGLRYTGNAGYSHSLARVAGPVGIIGPKAAAEYQGAAYWMGNGQFYRYAGQVQRIPCTVENVLRDRLDMNQADKIVAVANPRHGEIIWCWPSIDGGGENDHYVKYAVADDAWDWGTLPRTALTTRAAAGLYAAGTDGYLYEHEWGQVTPVVNVTLRCRKWASSPPIDFGPYAVAPDTPGMRIRARGRHVAIRLDGTFQTDAGLEPWFAESASFVAGEDGTQVMRITRMIPDVAFYDGALRIGAFRFDAAPAGEQ